MNQVFQVWGLTEGFHCIANRLKDVSLVLVLLIEGRPDSAIFPQTKYY